MPTDVCCVRALRCVLQCLTLFTSFFFFLLKFHKITFLSTQCISFYTMQCNMSQSSVQKCNLSTFFLPWCQWPLRVLSQTLLFLKQGIREHIPCGIKVDITLVTSIPVQKVGKDCMLQFFSARSLNTTCEQCSG